MKTRKNLSLMQRLGITAIAGLATVLSAGCGASCTEYNFEGKVRDEQVKAETDDGIKAYLKVKRDGREIVFYDTLVNGTLDSVSVDGHYYTGRYDYEKPAFEEAQKQYSDYLKQIQEIKTREVLEAIRKWKQ